MRNRSALPLDLQFRAFGTVEATERGISLKRLRGTDLNSPHRGVRLLTPLPIFDPFAAPVASAQAAWEHAAAYAVVMPPGAFFSHVTAARVWGIPLPLRLDTTLHVSVAKSGTLPGGRNIRGHRLQTDGADVTALGPLRLTSLARTWCDLGSILELEALIAAGDFLLWWRQPASLRLDRSDLEDAVRRFTGRRGTPLLRLALPFLSDRADSAAESKMRVRFWHAGLPAPEVNREVYDDLGNFIGMPDLRWPEYRSAFDYEGDHHRTDRIQWGKDLRRAPRFEDAKWSYLRAGAPDLQDSTEIIRLLRSRLITGGWSP